MSKLKILIALSVIVFALAGCNSCNQQKNSEITIGAILPLTGDAAFLGKDIKNGIDIKISDFNKDSKVKIKIVYEDSKADPKLAISAYEKLKAEGVKLIVGPAASSEVLALAKNANDDKVILFSPSASAPAITDAGDYIFRNELSDNLGAAKQGELAIQKLGWKNIGVIYVNNDYGVGVNESFTKKVNELGGKIAFNKAYQAGLKDFKPLLADINAEGLDGIFIVAQSEYPNVIKQIRERGLKTKIMATPVFENKDFITQLGKDYSEGIFYAYYGGYDPALNDPIIQDFNSKYQSVYSASPSYYAALGYDNAAIICDILTKANFKFNNLKDLFYQMKDFKGLTGTLSIDKNGDVDKPIYLKVVKDQNFVYYQ